MADMKEQLARLYEFQQLDTGIASRQKLLAGLDDGSAAEAELAEARKKLAALEKRAHELEALTLDKELRLKSAEEEKKSKSKQAYGGSITNPREVAALERKIEELGRLIDKLENEILELMEQSDATQQAVAKQRQVVEELERKVAHTKEHFAQQSERLGREIAEMTQQRHQIAAELDQGLLQQYDSIRERVGSPAVAAVRQGSCTACRMTVPSAYAPRLKAADQIVRCESCRRILYLPPGESPFKPEEDV